MDSSDLTVFENRISSVKFESLESTLQKTRKGGNIWKVVREKQKERRVKTRRCVNLNFWVISSDLYLTWEEKHEGRAERSLRFRVNCYFTYWFSTAAEPSFPRNLKNFVLGRFYPSENLFQVLDLLFSLNKEEAKTFWLVLIAYFWGAFIPPISDFGKLFERFVDSGGFQVRREGSLGRLTGVQWI